VALSFYFPDCIVLFGDFFQNKRLCKKETNQNVRYDVHNLASLDYGYYSDEVNYYTQNHVDDYETNDTDYYQMPVHIDEY